MMPRRERALLDLPAPPELAALRESVMRQKEMARLIGVDPGQLSRFEAGRGEMAYEKIRRYVHVLNLRLAASDPRTFLLERITNRAPLVEVKATDRLDVALEAMVRHDVSQVPVRAVGGRSGGADFLGVLTEVAACEAFVAEEPSAAMARAVGVLRLEPLDRVRRGDTLARIAALLASQSLVLVEDDEGRDVGFATRADLFPLLLGHTARRRA